MRHQLESQRISEIATSARIQTIGVVYRNDPGLEFEIVPIPTSEVPEDERVDIRDVDLKHQPKSAGRSI